MIKPEQIPNHVVADACDRFVISLGESHGYHYFYAIRSAIAAAINAWPSMEVIEVYDDPEWEGEPDRTVIELPLPQEKNDD